MQRSLHTFILTLLLPLTIYANTPADTMALDTAGLKRMKFQITFITPMGTNGVESWNTVNNISINLFGGLHAGFDGVEVGGFANVDRVFGRGIQAAGFGNYVLGPVQGAQAAGFMNLSGTLSGVQAAGFGNYAIGNVEGAQAAGFMNMGGKLIGVQAAGFMNLSLQTEGVQAAGFMNLTGGNSELVQAAGFMNVADSVDGLQVAGFLNVARKVKGLQIGFLNIAKEIDGEGIGFLSIYKNGYNHFTLWGSESMPVNVGFTTGSKNIYNVLFFSLDPFNTQVYYGLGWGIGKHTSIGSRWYADVDLSITNINEAFLSFETINTLYKLRAVAGFEITDHLAIFAGPTVNLFHTDEGPEADRFSTGAVRKWDDGNNYYSMWPGFVAGIRF